MNKQLVVVQPKKTIRQKVSACLAVAGTALVTAPAMAFDASVITAPIKEGQAAVDTTGGAILGLAVGVMIIGVIIGLVFRKGK